MENLTYQDLCRIVGQITLEYRFQIDKLKKDNSDLLELIKKLQDAQSERQREIN